MIFKLNEELEATRKLLVNFLLLQKMAAFNLKSWIILESLPYPMVTCIIRG